MTHRHPVSLLEDFVDKELTQAEAAEFEKALENSPELRAELESTRRLRELLANHLVPDPGEDYLENVTRIIMARTSGAERLQPIPIGERQKLERRLFYRSLMSAAASVALFIGAIWLGSAREEAMTRQPVPDVMVASSAADELKDEPGTELVTSEERTNVATGMFLLSPPGTSARFFGLWEVLHTK
jgi:anti-sigma factor RsiW